MVGRRVALLVATDRYRDTGLSRLAAPASDARQLAAVLRDIRIAGFEVTTLYNKPHYVVGRAIGDFYRDRRGNDLTLLYFTGHGVKDEDGRLYLAMTDTDRENLPFTGVPSEQIRAAMEGSRSRQKVLVLDCCYAGAFPVGLGIKGAPSVHALEQLGGRGCVVLTSSDAMQLSFEGNQWTETGPASLRSGPSSLFTRFLIEGLRTGKADLDGDGDITLDELYSYVHDRVIDEQPLQRPKKKEDIEGRICFAQNIYWTVPSRISDAVNSPYPPGKLSALEELRSLHYRGNVIVKQRVLETVRLLAEDDSKSVSGAASQFLSELILQEERRKAEEAARREAEEAARRQAEEAAQREAEEAARRQAEETAQREAEETARRQAEETAQREAEEAARRQAEETAQREAEEAARRQAEEAAQREAEEAARRQAEAVPAAVRPDEPAGEPDLLTAAAGTDVLAPVQPGLPDPGPATALVEPQPAGTLPAEIPPPRAGPSEPPTVGTIEPAPGGGLPDEDGGTPSPAVAAVAGYGMPAAAATAATDHPLASTLETAARSGDSTGELGRLTVPVSGGDGAPPVQRPPRRRGPVTAWIRRHRLPVFALACAAVAAAVTLPFISPSRPSSAGPSNSSPASHSSGPSNSSGPLATGTGLVSLGNLSENPTPVDVYLYRSGDSSPQFVEHDVVYGTILPYQQVSAGAYSVKMRAAGSSASSNPVWSISLTVQAGGAYTVAPLRASAQQGQLKVIDDNLTTPNGKSFVRVIQADLNEGQVTFHCSCAAGAPGNITTDAAPGTVSPQAPIPAGTWTMTATGPTGTASLPVTLTSGTVHTEIVIAKPGGGLEIINLVNAVPSYRRVSVHLPFKGPGVLIPSVAFSHSGATLAIASERVCLWNIAATRCTSTFGNANAYSLAFSPDDKTLAVADSSGGTYLWNVATSSQTATFIDPKGLGAYSVAFSPDGQTLAVGYPNGRTYLWNIATRKVMFTFPAPVTTKGVSSVAFTQDGTILAVGDRNGRAYLWNVHTRNLLFTLGNSGSKDVMPVAFSPDGKLLVAGDDNGHTYVWQVATGKLMAILPDPDSTGVISVACSRDDTTMATGDNNGRIYIWNVDTDKLITTLPDPDGTEINSVAFSANGKTLATGDQNGSVFLWYMSLSAAADAPGFDRGEHPVPVKLA